MRTNAIDMPLSSKSELTNRRCERPGPSPDSLHVAVVDEELPFPLNSGKRIRTLNLLKRLASRHRITYICHRNADAGEARRAEAHLRAFGIETVVVERTVPRKAGIGFTPGLPPNPLPPLQNSAPPPTMPPLPPPSPALPPTPPSARCPADGRPTPQALPW